MTRLNTNSNPVNQKQTDKLLQENTVHIVSKKRLPSLTNQMQQCDYKTFFQFLKRIFKEKFPDAGEFAPQLFRTDFEAAAIMAIADEFPGAIFKLCTFHLTKSFREKLISLYGGNFQKNKKVAEVWRFLRAVPYLNWSSSSYLIDAFLLLIKQTLPNDDRKSKLCQYLKNI